MTTAEGPHDAWVLNITVDELYGTEDRILAVEASRHTYRSNPSVREAPVLEILCDKADPAIAVAWWGQRIDASSGEEVLFEYRTDDDRVVKARAVVSSAPSGVFAFLWDRQPSGDHATAFLAELLGKEELIARVSDRYGTEVGTATFPIANLENRIDELTTTQCPTEAWGLT